MELSNVVSATVSSFIDYALFIVTIMIIWYVVKFFMAAPPTKEEKAAALQSQREAWGGMISEAGKKSKASRDERELKEYQKGLKNRASAVIDNLNDAFDASADAIHALDRKNPTDAIKDVDKFEMLLKRAWRNLRPLQSYAKDVDKAKIETIRAEVDALHVVIINQVKGKIPRKVEGNWDSVVGPIRTELVKQRQSNGAIFKELRAL